MALERAYTVFNLAIGFIGGILRPESDLRLASEEL